jgi:hypothetical protein
MGKHDSGYEPMPKDSYFTPAWVVEALIDNVRLGPNPIDPACGDLHIVSVLRVNGYDASGTDIKDGIDFLTSDNDDAECIVTNPPYGRRGEKLADKFIMRALDATRLNGGMVAMLLPVDFDSAVTRRHLFADHKAFTQKIILTKRIRWANLDQKKNGPKENHAWFIWDWMFDSHGPLLRYAPCLNH